MNQHANSNRRRLLIAGPTLAIFPCAALSPSGRVMAVTPSCGRQTPPQMEGPFFTPNSPRRQNIIDRGVTGAGMVLMGRVLSEDCKPIANALIDFWQTDAEGRYDNRGYRLRGHQFTDSKGNYRLETIVPGRYPGRTPHIHVKVQRPAGRVLTTQLYLEDHPANQGDFLFDHRLIMDKGSAGLKFDFVLSG